MENFEVKAYQAGQTARRRQLPVGAQPYLAGQEATAWLRGWYDEDRAQQPPAGSTETG